MCRRGANEKVELLCLGRLNIEELRRRVPRWVAGHHELLADAEPEIPDGLSDRTEDN